MTAARRRNKPGKSTAASSPILPRGEEESSQRRAVNLEVDTQWELVENATLSPEEHTGARRHYTIKVLRKHGQESPTQEFLKDICHEENEFGGLLAKVLGLLRAPKEEHWRYCEPGRGVGKGIFEFKAKGKKFRLFFFYGEKFGLASTLVVTTHGFSKKKPSTEEQDREFARAARMRDEFHAQGGADETL